MSHAIRFTIVKAPTTSRSRSPETARAPMSDPASARKPFQMIRNRTLASVMNPGRNHHPTVIVKSTLISSKRNPALGLSGDGAVNVRKRGEWLRPLLAITGVFLTRSRRLGASIAYFPISNRPGCAEAWPVLLCSGRPVTASGSALALGQAG